MTTISLPPEPRQLPALVVDVASIRTCAADLLAASAQVDDLGTFVAGDARIGDWSGLGATAYHAAIRPLGRRADAMSLALRGVARRVDGHADEMERLDEARTTLTEVRAHLLREISALRQEIAGADESAAPQLQQDADGLRRQVAAYEADLTTWTGEVDAEETAMNAAFVRVLTLARVERRYGGEPDPADEALSTKPSGDASPREVNQWWDGLTTEQQQAIIAASPGSIGNLHGIPADARHAANTVALDRDLADWGSLDPDSLTDDERVWLENARAADEARQQIARGVDPVTGAPVEPQLYVYDPAAFDGDGAIAIAAGDLGTADNVSVVVPGFGTDAESAAYQADRALTLYEASRSLDGSETNATLAWIGYDAPDNAPWDEGWDGVGVVSEDMAEAGGGRLSDTLDGLRAARDGEPAHLTAIGHSYGSTTTGHAAHDHGIPVDDLVFVGSPGVGGDTNDVGDTGVDPDHVWAGANSRDPITYLGNHGSFHLETFGGGGLGDDPAEDDFGANRFRAEDPSRPGYPSLDQHSLYFDHDTESLHNIASVVNGDYEDVVHAEHNYDPWWGGVQDPELDREPTTTDTFDEP